MSGWECAGAAFQEGFYHPWNWRAWQDFSTGQLGDFVPAAEDRFASDLLLPERIADPWLRGLTASAAAAPIPILLGGIRWSGRGCDWSSAGRPGGAMEVTPGIRRDPVPDLDAVGQDEGLVARIHDEIARDGPITFARFMDLALYDPDGGYYRAEAARPGRDGDFLTAPEAHPIFGAALARAVADAWDRLGRPDPFVLREYGAGTGTLALAILDGLAAEQPDLAARRATTRSRSSRAGSRPSRRGSRRPGHGAVLVAASQRERRSIGFVLANEVLDALPVHRVVVRDGACARSSSGRATARSSTSRPIRPRPPSPPASPTSRPARRRPAGGDLPRSRTPGWTRRRPASSAASCCSSTTATPRPSSTTRVRRRDGTLRAYLRHRVHDDPYVHVGRQDLTAHVDVTAVETRRARRRSRPPRHDDPGRVPRRPRHGGPAARDPGRPGDDARGLPRRPLGAHAPARSRRDGPVPRHGVRPRLAGRAAARRASATGSDARGHGPASRAARAPNRAMYLLPHGPAPRHDSPRSGTT